MNWAHDSHPMIAIFILNLTIVIAFAINPLSFCYKRFCSNYAPQSSRLLLFGRLLAIFFRFRGKDKHFSTKKQKQKKFLQNFYQKRL